MELISIRSMIRDDRAVSETLGYILIFGIALTAIAIILLVGNSIINNEKSNDNFQNMVQSFDIIQSNMKQVALDGTPVKTTVIRMDGGMINMTTTTARTQVSYGTYNYDTTTGQIMFSKADDLMENVSFENGGVWKSTDGYSTMVSQPRIYVTPHNDTLVLNIFKLNSTSPDIANAGTGAMNIQMSYNTNSKVIQPAAVSGGTVTLTLDTKYAQAWKQYLNDATDGTGVTVTYDDYPDGVEAHLAPVSNLIISEHWIDVSVGGLFD